MNKEQAEREMKAMVIELLSQEETTLNEFRIIGLDESDDKNIEIIIKANVLEK